MTGFSSAAKFNRKGPEVIMEQQLYAELYDMLSYISARRTSVELKSLHAGSLILLSRHVREQLEKFEAEVAARAKAEFEDAKCTYEHVAGDYGEGFDAIERDHIGRVVHPIKK